MARFDREHFLLHRHSFAKKSNNFGPLEGVTSSLRENGAPSGVILLMDIRKLLTAKRGHHGVRALGLVVLLVGVLACTWKPNCTNGTCPSYALANPWILREERVVVVVVGLLVLFLIFWRVFYHGQFPNKVSRDGLEYPETEVAEGTKTSLTALDDALQSALNQIDVLGDDIKNVTDAVGEEFVRIWNDIEDLKSPDEESSGDS